MLDRSLHLRHLIGLIRPAKGDVFFDGESFWGADDEQRQLIAPWQQRNMIVLTVSFLAVMPLAWWFARRLASPISVFTVLASRAPGQFGSAGQPV